MPHELTKAALLTVSIQVKLLVDNLHLVGLGRGGAVGLAVVVQKLLYLLAFKLAILISVNLCMDCV